MRLSNRIQRSGLINRSEHLHIWIILSFMLCIYNRRQYASIERTNIFARKIFCGISFVGTGLMKKVAVRVTGENPGR